MPQNITPFFSIIICTYNRANLITRALDSLMKQTEKDWEAIIVDDASDDHTREVLESYLSQSSIRYYKHSKNHGCAESKNTGLSQAQGKYLTFLDSDDEYAPNHLKIRKEYLTQNPEIDLLHSNVEIIGNPYVPDAEHPGKLILINDCVIGGTFFIKRECLSAEDRFSNVYSDDSRFLITFAKKNKIIRKIEAPTYIYHRDTEDSMCNTIASS